jgi:4a-hydroxytetrahydrobiopterin dehydratase
MSRYVSATPSDIESCAPSWNLIDGELLGEFVLKDFEHAILFINKIAAEVIAFDHHPTITNTYNKVLISLITHDTNSITKLDIELAKRIGDIFRADF